MNSTQGHSILEEYPELHPGSSHLDRALLSGVDEYSQYFNLLLRYFHLMLASFREISGSETVEGKLVATMLERFLNTVEVLRLKHLYAPSDGLKVDLSASGLPNFLEISAIDADLHVKEDRLRALPTLDYLKSELVESLITEKKDSPERLWQIAQRLYYEKLDSQKLFLAFTPGELIALPKDNQNPSTRSYLYSWGCYDFRRNRPYVWLMGFEQDASREPLDRESSDLNFFLDVLKSEGSRAADVGILASTIDDYIAWVHPKVVRRLRIGPIYSPMMFHYMEVPEMSAEEVVVQKLFINCQAHKEEAVLSFRDDTIVSIRQEKRGLLSAFSAKKVREIFSISQTDPDCREASATNIHRTVLLPHHIHQHISVDELASVKDFGRCDRWVTFDDGGELNVINR